VIGACSKLSRGVMRIGHGAPGVNRPEIPVGSILGRRWSALLSGDGTPTDPALLPSLACHPGTMSRIAIVDDSCVARMYIHRALGDVDVVEFEWALAYIAALRSGLEVDGVVTDLLLDGLTESWPAALVVRYCQSVDVPVVVVTPHGHDLAAISKELGCPVLAKPVDGAVLRQALGLMATD